MRIGIVGAGHVGLVSGACLATVGHSVTLLDIDAERVEQLREGGSPFYEPGLDEVLERVRAGTDVCFTTDPAQALGSADLVFLCVDTPNAGDGQVDLRAVVGAVETVRRHVAPRAVVVNRSTAPVGTADYIRSMLRDGGRDDVLVAVNPEFLAEGSAVRDFLVPDRVVVGAWDDAAVARVREAYDPILRHDLPDGLPDDVHRRAQAATGDVPFVVAEPPTAELIKYAANAFLAVKLSFINEIAQIAEQVGGDVTQVSAAIGLDRRIGPMFLRAGIGWGGSCFPKDIVALQGMAETRGLTARMLRAANDVNSDQQAWVLRALQRHLKTLVGRRIAIWGLTFKPGTDDLRNAPALDIARTLAGLSARVRAYDPAVSALPATLEGVIELAADPLAAAAEAEALILVTEWPEFAAVDLGLVRASMRGNLLVDGRNALDADAARAAGFDYRGVGR